MLMPKRTKYRKQQRGRTKGKAKGGTALAFGEYGLKALEPAWVTNRQIEAARRSITRYVKRGGKLWIRIFPDKPLTAKPAETRMRKISISQNLDPVLYPLDETSFQEEKRSDRRPGFDPIQIPEIDDGKLLSKAIPKAPLWKAPGERHLASFKPGWDTHPRPGLLPLVPPARSLPVS